MKRVCNSSNMDGEVVNLEVMTPNSDYTNSYNEDYPNEFWEGDDFNFADGNRAKTTLNKIGKNVFGKKTIFNADERARRRERRQARKDTRVGARSQKKILQAQAQSDVAKSLGDQSGDIALAKALGTPQAEQKKGLSTGAIIGITLGGLALVGAIVYFAIKKNKETGK